MASQTAVAQEKIIPLAPVQPYLSDLPSTSTAPHPTQATYRKVALPNIEQIKPPIRKPTKWQESFMPNPVTSALIP